MNKETIPMNDSSSIEVLEVYRDEDVYVERFNILDESGTIIAASWIEKKLDGTIIGHYFRKPEFLIRHDKLTQILPSIIN